MFRADIESGRRHRDADYRRSPPQAVWVGHSCPTSQRRKKLLTAKVAENNREFAEKTNSALSVLFSAFSADKSLSPAGAHAQQEVPQAGIVVVPNFFANFARTWRPLRLRAFN